MSCVESGLGVRPLAVAGGVVGEAGKVEWDGGMLRRAAGGGRMPQLVRETVEKCAASVRGSLE